jgi:hypothetical protein
VKANYEANREARLAQQKAYYAATKDDRQTVARRWAAANRAKMLAYHAAYVKRNRNKHTARTALYRAMARNAVPAWADLEAMQVVYDRCAQMRQADGQDWHVDHIVPMKSDIVCGLHVENNLAVVLGADNRAKSNRHWPDMP